MSQQTRESRMDEWAELIGVSVPDSAHADAEELLSVHRSTEQQE